MDSESLKGYQIAHFNNHRILREKRTLLGMTQKQVAEKAGILLQSYQRFESGERNIKTASFQVACRVIEALDMNVSDFYHNEYAFGETVYPSKEGLRFAKTGRLINEEVSEEE